MITIQYYHNYTDLDTLSTLEYDPKNFIGIYGAFSRIYNLISSILMYTWMHMAFSRRRVS